MIYFPCDPKDRIGKKYMYVCDEATYFKNHVFLITSYIADNVFYATDLNDSTTNISIALGESTAKKWTEILPERQFLPFNRLELITRD